MKNKLNSLCIEHTFFSKTNLGIGVRLNFSCFAVFLGSMKNIEECVVHTIPKNVLVVWRRLWEQFFVSHKKKNVMVMNTHSRRQINRQGRV
jgi:hypothetical protein